MSNKPRRSLSQLLLGAAPAILLAAASPADAGNASSALRTCLDRDARRVERALAACGAVIDNQRATVGQIQTALTRRANLRAARNDLTGAAADLEQAQVMGAEGPAVLAALGRVRARLNDPDAALAAFREAVEHGGDEQASFDAWSGIGAIQVERRQWRDASQAYSQALRYAPEQADQAYALAGRAHAQMGSGDTEGALDDYRLAVALAPRNIGVVLALADAQRMMAAQGDSEAFDEADRMYYRAIQIARGDGASQRSNQARAYAGRGNLYWARYQRGQSAQDLRDATSDFEDAVEANAQNVDALAGRAAVYAETPATRQRAIADLDRAVRIAPDSASLYRTRGDIYADIGDDERAMRDYDVALQRGDAQSYRTYFQRGVIYMNEGDYVRADQNFAQAEALARQGPLPPGLDTGTAVAEALAMRSRATWNLIDLPGIAARDAALRARNYADEAARWRPGEARYQATRCLTRSVAGGEWDVAQEACRAAISMAQQANNRDELSEAYGAMGMLQLRWALAGASNAGAEATHLQSAAINFTNAVNADAGANTTRAALHRYAHGVALECLGRQIEANRLMLEALNADRSVEARFLTHRIRHCQA